MPLEELQDSLCYFSTLSIFRKRCCFCASHGVDSNEFLDAHTHTRALKHTHTHTQRETSSHALSYTSHFFCCSSGSFRVIYWNTFISRYDVGNSNNNKGQKTTAIRNTPTLFSQLLLLVCFLYRINLVYWIFICKLRTISWMHGLFSAFVYPIWLFICNGISYFSIINFYGFMMGL